MRLQPVLSPHKLKLMFRQALRIEGNCVTWASARVISPQAEAYVTVDNCTKQERD